MDDPGNPLPSFRNPPLVGVALKVQFERPPKFTNAHLGAFWRSLGGDWSETSDLPVHPEQFERFEGPSPLLDAFQFQISQDPGAALMMRQPSTGRYIAFQRTRFAYGWLRGSSGSYMRFTVLKPEFDERLAALKEFFRQEGLGRLAVNQWEVAYLNEIPSGTLWRAPGDWPHVVVCAGSPPLPHGVGTLETMKCDWQVALAEQLGRLYVSLQHRRTGVAPGGDDVLGLNLVARGPVGKGDESAVNKGIELGHQVIVRSFVEMSSTSARQYWQEEK